MVSKSCSDGQMTTRSRSSTTYFAIHSPSYVIAVPVVHRRSLQNPSKKAVPTFSSRPGAIGHLHCNVHRAWGSWQRCTRLVLTDVVYRTHQSTRWTLHDRARTLQARYLSASAFRTQNAASQQTSICLTHPGSLGGSTVTTADWLGTLHDASVVELRPRTSQGTINSHAVGETPCPSEVFEHRQANVFEVRSTNACLQCFVSTIDHTWRRREGVINVSAHHACA